MERIILNWVGGELILLAMVLAALAFGVLCFILDVIGDGISALNDRYWHL